LKSLVLIDVAGLMHANWHATVDLPFGEAFSRTVDRTHAIARGFDHAVVCYDWGPYIRKGISEAYKAQRDKPDAVFVEQYQRVKDRLKADGLHVIGSKGYESDDLIATIVDKLRGKYEILVASADKDLLQLVSDEDDISVMSTRTGDVFKAAQVRAKLGVNPDCVRDWLSLVGDKADNIMGVPGVGPTIAAKIINSPEGISGLISGEKIEGITPRIVQLVKDNLENVKLASKLVTLYTDAPVNIDDIFASRKVEPIVGSGEKFEEEDMQEKVTEAVFTDDSPVETKPEPVTPVIVPEVPKFTEPKPVAPTTALAKVPVRFEDELEPRTLGNASILSDKIVNSRLYSNFANSDATLGIILAGREMGMRAMESLRAFHIVEGKPTLHAHLIVARAKQHQDCEYFQMIESSNTKAIYETKNRRNRTPTRLEYTIEQAQQSGLAPEVIRTKKVGEGKDTRGNWEKRPDEMLRKTCAVQLARIEYPDAAMGLYSPEELGAEV
jgi:5'-3' exonuclease